MESVERVAEAVLYEGYLLYPYTRSTTKNQQRWNFGGVYPRAYSEATADTDPWIMQTQCLLLGSPETRIDVKIRFLHIVDRTVLGVSDGTETLVPELRIGEQVYRPWEESVEREILIEQVRVEDLLDGVQPHPFAIEGDANREALVDSAGAEVGALVRQWQPIQGSIDLALERVDGDCFRLTVRITNTTPWHPSGNERASRRLVLRNTCISTHTILEVHDGQWISLLEPPEKYAAAVAACNNIKTWPVLAGDAGDTHLILSSPIILYDYPQVSPESPGDLFDATEIDEILTLSVMTLTDDEKREMRESDPRGREILERTEALTPEQMMNLHGAIRGLQAIRREDV